MNPAIVASLLLPGGGILRMLVGAAECRLVRGERLTSASKCAPAT